MAKKPSLDYETLQYRAGGTVKMSPVEKRELKRLQDSASSAKNTDMRLQNAKKQAGKTMLNTTSKPTNMASKKTTKTGSRFA